MIHEPVAPFALTSLLHDKASQLGVWSKQVWLALRADQEREEPCATCGVMTKKRYSSEITGVGRDKFLFTEFVYQCDPCRRTWCIDRLRARQENVGIYPAVRQRERIYLTELENVA